MNMCRARVAVAAVALAACSGPPGSAGGGDGGGASDAGPDLSDQAFDVPMLEVAIDIAPDDWDSLRQQRRTRHSELGREDCLSTPVPNPYTWFPATIAIDGDAIGLVGLRKKGQFGSQSTLRPSLKLKLDKFIPDRTWLGLERFALSNSKQDPSLARTCVAYDVFRAAGLPAPRCTLAHVTVNGADLGVYVAHEEIKKEFLRRNFDDPEGNLYEGTGSDFRPDFIGSFEQETNRSSDPSRADLEAVLEALFEHDGSDLVLALDEVIDLDAFFRFWATESLVWHHDGYAGNANNFFVYADPSDGGRFHFLPWGTDATFIPDNRPTVPDSVLAFSALTQRVYQTTAGRDRYYQELAAVLDEAWRPRELTAETERIAELVRPLLPDAAWRADLDQASAAMIEAISGRRDAIDTALAGGQPAWTDPLRTAPCRVPVGPISGTFSTTWRTLDQDPFTAGSGALETEIDGEPIAVEAVGARAGLVPTGPRVQLLVALADDRRLSVVVNFPPDARWFEPYFTAGVHPLLAPPLRMSLTELDAAGEVIGNFEVAEGTFTFDAAGTEMGAAVQGSFEATLYRIPP
jgi:hypothetical protein